MEFKVEIVRRASVGMLWVNAPDAAKAAEYATAYGAKHGWRGFTIGEVKVA